MIDLDLFGEIFSTLRRNAMRTALTAIGVFWGVLLLIVMVGFGNGLETGTRNSMSGLVTNSMYIWGQRTSVPYRGQSPGRFVRMTMDDVKALQPLPGVDVVAPRVSLGGRRATQSVTRGEKTGSFEVMGDTPEYLRLQPMDIHGRFVNHIDMVRKRKVTVIGSRVAEVLFPGGDEPIGQSIKIKGIDFMVVGVFRTRQTGERGARHAATVYTPLTTFQKALSSSPHIHYMAVLSTPDVRAGAIEQEVVALLRKRHRVAPNDKEAIGSFNADAEVQKIGNLFRGISLLVYLVGSATLFAGLVGVSNIMMVSVRERTREIGIRKAIGATPRTVMAQIVLESMALASVAGYLGLVLGVGLLELVGAAMGSGPATSKTMFAPPEVTLTTAVVATVAVALGGGLAGLFPALHAARIRTVMALRNE
ncbi:MAG: ABC transporter permease [Deltaproteobacteria bacterium]|nr:MAG: ABC transporter permease [Deltaproteobacteria bacterium]